LVDVANIIKIDLLTLSEQELIEHVDILKQFDVKLLAEKVETDAQYQQCKQLGFDLYQGYFFCKPTIIDDKPVPDNKAAALQIISELQRPNISITEVENLVKQDISLSYKLLRCLNSAAFALPKHVNSLKQAVIYLGLDAIRSWATIIVFSNVESPVSGALLNTALIRAKMAEILAEPFDCEPETAFILGLFSPADAFFNKPMPELLTDLPISNNIKSALQEAEGPLGKLLMFVRTHERGSLTIMPNSLSIPDINQAFVTATDWAATTLETIN